MAAMLIRRRDDGQWEVAGSRDGRPPYDVLTRPLSGRAARRAFDVIDRRARRLSPPITAEEGTEE